MAVLIHRNERRAVRRRIRATQFASATVVAIALGGMVAVGPLQQSPADAATATSSEITIDWADDSSTAADYQPERDPDSPHYNDFDGLSITVSQTTGIVDQTVRVSVAGFTGTRNSTGFFTLSSAMNFVQAMQCWGDDPLADDFHETCQWGGRFGVQANGLGEGVLYDDAVARLAITDVFAPVGRDVPFRTVDGQEASGKRVVVHDPASGADLDSFPIQQFFGPSTTNEVSTARIGADGTGTFNFETQSSKQAPQLGCGTASQTRCWLVVVPRGSHFGGDGDECSGVFSPTTLEPYNYGQANAIQGGSPVDDKCDYWDNRIVVPLDFAPSDVRCEVGGTETRVIGSQLMIGAMSSWQPALCETVGSTFSFSTNPDSVARAQLIETGVNTPNLAYSGFPVSSGELLSDYERDLLADTDLTYAPVAVSGVVIAYFAETASGRLEQLVLSPRLIAKLLTQSYKFTVPTNASSNDKSDAHLGAVNRTYTYFYQDPEFKALNPTNYDKFGTVPALVVSGPSGADAIRQVWRWIFADDDAVAFMNGDPDPWGMTVNPYYLPKGHPNAQVPWYYDVSMNYIATPETRTVGLTNLDGTPQKLTDQVLDTFPKLDQSLVPFTIPAGTTRFDTLQYAPYVDSFLNAARQASRADPNSKIRWDPNVPNLSGGTGAWASGGAQPPGGKFMLAVTDTVSALRYGLSTASLVLPNTVSAADPDGVAVDADVAGMTSALSALEATSLDSVKQVDPAQVPTDGYPLTIVTYAGVNLTKSTAAARLTMAIMLELVTTVGQVPGSGIGDLPAGYVPLTDELAEQAAASVDEIASYVAPSPTPTPRPTSSNGFAQDDYDAGGGLGADGSGSESADPSVTAGVDELSSDRTAVSSSEPIARSGLVIALVVGLAGFLIAPILFRGRGFL